MTKTSAIKNSGFIKTAVLSVLNIVLSVFKPLSDISENSLTSNFIKNKIHKYGFQCRIVTTAITIIDTFDYRNGLLFMQRHGRNVEQRLCLAYTTNYRYALFNINALPRIDSSFE